MQVEIKLIFTNIVFFEVWLLRLVVQCIILLETESLNLCHLLLQKIIQIFDFPREVHKQNCFCNEKQFLILCIWKVCNKHKTISHNAYKKNKQIKVNKIILFLKITLNPCMRYRFFFKFPYPITEYTCKRMKSWASVTGYFVVCNHVRRYSSNWYHFAVVGGEKKLSPTLMTLSLLPSIAGVAVSSHRLSRQFNR